MILFTSSCLFLFLSFFVIIAKRPLVAIRASLSKICSVLIECVGISSAIYQWKKLGCDKLWQWICVERKPYKATSGQLGVWVHTSMLRMYMYVCGMTTAPCAIYQSTPFICKERTWEEKRKAKQIADRPTCWPTVQQPVESSKRLV